MTAKAREKTDQNPCGEQFIYSGPLLTDEVIDGDASLPPMPLPDWDDEVAINALTNAMIPVWDIEQYGYVRESSDEVLPAFGEEAKIPILDIDLVLPRIIDEAVIRVHQEEEKRGPRLLGASPKNAVPKGHQIVVAEFPPIKVTCLTGYSRYVLQMPYLIEGFNPNTGQMTIAFAFEPITSLDQTIYVPPLPHLSREGQVCIYEPPCGWKGIRKMEPLEAACTMMNHFWFTNFSYFNENEPVRTLGIPRFDFSVEKLFQYWEPLSLKDLEEKRDLNKFMPIRYKLDQWTQRQVGNDGYMGRTRHELEWYLTPQAQAAADASNTQEDSYQIQYWKA